MRWRMLAGFVTLIGLLAVQTDAFAGGADSSGREDDIRFSADWRWAGGSQGGYYPIRISLQNAGLPRTIDVVLKATSNGLPNVSRRVNVDQNASVTFSLLVPLVGENSFGELRVYANGRELESLRNPVSLPNQSWNASPFATLVIAESPADFSEYEAAVTSVIGFLRFTGYSNQASDHQHVEPVRMPDSWLAYSSVDLVIAPIETLEKLDSLQRKAIFDWTLTGGCLATYSERDGSRVSPQQVESLFENSLPTVGQAWEPVSLKLRRPINRVQVDEYGNETSSTPGTTVNFRWPAAEDTLQVRKHGLGRIVMLPPEPFDGTYQDWAWLLNGLDIQQQVMPIRFGASGRAANSEFLHVLIPGVRSVPVIAFAVVISLFALLIGPVNYYVLAKRKRQGFLVVTIPAIALLSSLAMFAYSFVAHGVSVRSRVRSVTWIDQGTQSAVSMARIAWFAGFAPSDGLVFSPSTTFIPIWHAEGGFSNGSIDWTESQHLVSGFLRSRTRTQALTTTVRDERGRLTVSRSSSGDSAGSLSVTSGLEWALEALIVWDDAGNAFRTGQLEPGQAATLTPLTDADRENFHTLLNRSTPGIPSELTAEANDFFDMRSASNSDGSVAVSRGQMERAITQMSQGIKPQNASLARRYVAIAAEPPGIEFGTDVKIVDGWHLIIGTY